MEGSDDKHFLFPNELDAYDLLEDLKNNNNDPNKDSDEDEEIINTN